MLLNTHPDYRRELDPRDIAMLGPAGAAAVSRHLATRPDHVQTPLHALPNLAAALGIGALLIKDEASRLGLGSFKALGGAYAVVTLTLEEASRRLGRTLDEAAIRDPAVREVAATMTFACATDGNHGRSVAQGAGLVGGRAVIFVHGGVSEERIAAIASFGAEIRRVAGTYDDSVRDAARVAEAEDWTVVSDTSWEAYERIPALVMQGYTAIAQEVFAQISQAPTHIFVQAGVGGIAAAMAAQMATRYGAARPIFIVVEPDRAACVFEAARQGRPVKIAHGEPTVMAMLECYEPSPVALRVLYRAADAFMTATDADAVDAMNRLARPTAADPAIVSGESGAAGLAGLLAALRDPDAKAALRLDDRSRVLLINTEGATDPARYAELVGLCPQAVLAASA